MRPILLTAGLLSCLVWAGCTTSNEYQKQVALPNGGWDSGFKPEFEMQITDTQALYDVCILLRNDDSYNFSNLWVKLHILPPGDSVYKIYDRVELPLSDAKGYWLGRNFGDTWEQKVEIAANDSTMFHKPGTYKIRFEHIMRTDPLYGILNIGLNIKRKS